MMIYSFQNKDGFTLIELLIVVAVIGILVAVALPSYQTHVRTANRVDMQFAMTEMALVSERQYARQNSYPADAASTGITLPDSYSTTLLTSGASFIITATPLSGQVNDACGTMTVDQAGFLTVSNATLTVAECW